MRLLGVILHNGLYIVMEFMSKVRACPQPVGLKAAQFLDKIPGLGLHWVDTGQLLGVSPQGNLVNFLRTRGRVQVSPQQLLQFSL